MPIWLNRALAGKGVILQEEHTQYDALHPKEPCVVRQMRQDCQLLRERIESYLRRNNNEEVHAALQKIITSNGITLGSVSETDFVIDTIEVVSDELEPGPDELDVGVPILTAHVRYDIFAEVTMSANFWRHEGRFSVQNVFLSVNTNDCPGLFDMDDDS